MGRNTAHVITADSVNIDYLPDKDHKSGRLHVLKEQS